MTKTIITPAALRHAVYRDLLSHLPIASVGQVEAFMANLALCRNRCYPKDIFKVRQRLLLLRVSPDIAEISSYFFRTIGDTERSLSRKYGPRLGEIPGFYRDPDSGRWRVNLPAGCALYGYRSGAGFYNGVLCQPLNKIDYFFLLSSRGQGGFSPVRMTDDDRKFFERSKVPVDPVTDRPPSAAFDAERFRWTGRRFVEE